MSTTAELLRTRELRAAEVLADQIAKEVLSAFRSLVTAQQLIKELNDVVCKAGGITECVSPEHADEMLSGLARLDPIEELDVWELDNGSTGAGSVRDALELARGRKEREASCV
jgi:hypothetical protein